MSYGNKSEIFKRIKQLNDLAICKFMDNYDTKIHSDVGIWGLNLTKITLSIAIEESRISEELIKGCFDHALDPYDLESKMKIHNERLNSLKNKK